MVVDFGLTLIVSLISVLARFSVDTLFERAQSRPRDSARPMAANIVDLVTGTPATTRARVLLPATGFNMPYTGRADPYGVARRSPTTGSSRPYWVLLGIHHAEGQTDVIPALYGEPVELRVARGRYGLSALFMTKPTSFDDDDKPLLVAVGSGHEVLASADLQPVTVRGSRPTSDQIEYLKAKTPVEQLPFCLSPARATPRPPSQQIDAPPRLFQLPRAVEPDRPQIDPPPRPFQLPRAVERELRTIWDEPDRPQIAQQVFPTCEARTVSGQRCHQPQRMIRGRVCWEHFVMICQAREVLWHESGERVRRDEL
jgi:hypothetical protein